MRSFFWGYVTWAGGRDKHVSLCDDDVDEGKSKNNNNKKKNNHENNP